MFRLLIRWLITTLAIFMVPHLVSGVTVDSFGAALAAAAILGLLNVLVRPVLILLTLPLTLISLGFFLLILNAVIFRWVGAFVSGFHVETFGSAFFASILVSLVSWVLNWSIEDRNGRRVITVYRGPTITKPQQNSTIDLNQGDRGRWE